MTGNSTALGYLSEVLKAADRAADLVRQILTFSRRQEQQRKPVQLRYVVGDALKLLRATVPSSIRFHISLLPNTPTVLADATQIHQIVMNLGTNASHAMREKPGKLEVKLEAYDVSKDLALAHPDLQPGRYARLSLSDTGHGMDRRTLERIFEPFFTTKPPGEGTGLGLAVVHGIVKAHDGCLIVYSQPDEGTVFHLSFPALNSEEVEVRVGENPLPYGHGEHILFVDDEQALLSLGKIMLERLGYRVTTTASPLTALENVRTAPNEYSIVITDHTMPEMIGPDLAKHLLQIKPNLAIILCTGYSATLTTEGVQAMGIREFVLKPLSGRALAETIRRILDSTKSD